MRVGNFTRKTNEVEIVTRVNLDGTGVSNSVTGVKYLDHMLMTLAIHSMIDIELKASGDLIHHISEDSAICIGSAIKAALGDRSGIIRFGYSKVPMDDSLSFASIDLAKRPYSVIDLKLSRDGVEDMPAEDIIHFYRSFADSLEATVHLSVDYGNNDHHKSESAFKAFALALRQAVSLDSRRKTVASSKGML